MSGILSFDDVCVRSRDEDEPTMAEIDGVRRELEKMFPKGMIMHGEKPEEPSDGDMYAEPDGRIMIWTGGEWKQLVISPPVVTTVTATSASFSPPRWGPPGPITHAGTPRGGVRFDPEPERDPEHTELLEILLCPECDFELGSQACSPRHAFLADNPMNHRLLKPLLERYQEEIRYTEGRECPDCKVPMATQDCPHADVRGDQARVSRERWRELLDVVDEVKNLRDERDVLWQELDELRGRLAALGTVDPETTGMPPGTVIIRDGAGRELRVLPTWADGVDEDGD